MHERGKGFLARYFRVHARKAGFAVEVLNSTLAAESIAESLHGGGTAAETDGGAADIELFRHTARMAVAAIGSGDLYVVRIRLPSDEGAAGTKAESWMRDAEMWTDLMELIQMEGGDLNPHAVALGAPEPETSGGRSAGTGQSEGERREARVAARRKARREAKAWYDHWYSHANPG